MKRQLALGFTLLLTMTSFAQEQRFKIFRENSEDRALIRNSRSLAVFYENLAWNNSATDLDQAYMFLRDKRSGELTELLMTETEPNSGVFSAEFAIGVLKSKQIAAEIYAPPQSYLTGKNRTEVTQAMIKDGSIKRKPFLMRVLRDRGQLVDVFDDKEAALKAYNEYRKKMGLSPEALESSSIVQIANQEKPVTRKPVDTSTLQSLFMANETDLSNSNRRNQEQREVMENLEKKRRQALLDEAKTWRPAQVSRNRRQATESIKQAVNEISAQKFEESMTSFLKASDLDPSSEDLYEQYGVSLFRAQKYNQSIVVLSLSQPSAKRQPEKHFYLGMNFIQLKDFARAIQEFDKVLGLPENEAYLASAAFYKGTSYLEMREFQKSKDSFQYVLDNSKDPKMDARAEKFIEYAMDQEALDRKRSNWFFADGVLGLMYDSNIVLANDQAREQGLVTGEEGWRLLTQLSTQFRPYYSDSDEVRIGVDLTALRSFDSSFGSNPTAEAADPYLAGLNVPWTHRSTLNGKAYFFDLIPGFEAIVMDLDGNGSKVITKSSKLNFNNTLVANRNWIAKADLFTSFNDSEILGNPTIADSTTIGTRLSSILILNKDLERYLIPDLAYQVNDARGDDYAFSRLDLGLTFTSAVFEKWMWNSRVAYFLANYRSIRVDNNLSVTTGLSRRISRNWNWGFMGSYIVNDSNINPYDKFNIVTTFSFSY